MAEQMRPASPEQAPDPADNYERAHPEHEAGMGRLDNDIATPTDRPDDQIKSVPNRQESSGQINAHEVIDQRKTRPPGTGEAPPRVLPAKNQPDHSMHEEEPQGWDMAPTDIQNPRDKRHPKTKGRGGTP